MGPSQPTPLSVVAHELRGPLTALHASTELLERDLELLDRQQVRVMVTAIHRRALSLRSLVENLFSAATLREGKFTIQTRPTDLREVATEIQCMVAPLLDRKAQRLRLRVRRAVPIVWADDRRIGQALLNLVSNASKYSPEGTTIDVSITTRAEVVRVTVADRGPGFTADVASRLFQPYYRAGRTDSEGLGIGLSIVRSIIEAHGGRVGAKGRRPAGAAFWFEIDPLGARLPQISCLRSTKQGVGVLGESSDRRGRRGSARSGHIRIAS